MNNRFKYFAASLLIALLLVGCFQKRSSVSPYDKKEAQDVKVLKDLPQMGKNCDFFGTMKGSDGEGIGDLGTKGTRERALLDLKVKAAKKQANRIIIIKETLPHYHYGLNQVFDNYYIVEANTYFCR